MQAGIVLGALAAPVAAWRLYERHAPLPPPLGGTPFPLLARLHIRRAMWAGSVAERTRHLDGAMRRVLASGLGAASPQATALLVYLSQLYCEQREPDVRDLAASFAALSHKPHVGEGVREERARLEMSLCVAARLCDVLQHRDPARCAAYAQRALDAMQHAPPHIGGGAWADHPLKARFASILNADGNANRNS